MAYHRGNSEGPSRWPQKGLGTAVMACYRGLDGPGGGSDGVSQKPQRGLITVYTGGLEAAAMAYHRGCNEGLESVYTEALQNDLKAKFVILKQCHYGFEEYSLILKESKRQIR